MTVQGGRVYSPAVNATCGFRMGHFGKWKKWSYAFAVFLFACESMNAVRFPNAVEKKIVLTGQSATTVAEIFGLNSSGSSFIPMQLGRNDDWAVYLLKHDTATPLMNDNEGVPSRFNQVMFTESPRPPLLCRSQLTGESQGSMVAMGTASILKEGGYKNGYNRLIFVISAYSLLLYVVDYTGS